MLELKGHVEEFSLYNKYKYNKKYLNSFMGGYNILRFSILKDSSVFNVVKRLERYLI